MNEDRKALADEIANILASKAATRLPKGLAFAALGQLVFEHQDMVLTALRSDAAAEMRERHVALIDRQIVNGERATAAGKNHPFDDGSHKATVQMVIAVLADLKAQIEDKPARKLSSADIVPFCAIPTESEGRAEP